MGKFFDGDKIIGKVWNIKDIFKVEGWKKGDIATSNYWDMSTIDNSNVVTKRRDI